MWCIKSIKDWIKHSQIWKRRNDRRSERNLCNCVKKPEKNSGLQRCLNPWPRDTGAMLYQLSYWRHWLHSSAGGASHRYREVTGSNTVEVLNFFQASLRNCINYVHCDDHFFFFISFPQFIYDLFHMSLTLRDLLARFWKVNLSNAKNSAWFFFKNLFSRPKLLWSRAITAL